MTDAREKRFVINQFNCTRRGLFLVITGFLSAHESAFALILLSDFRERRRREGRQRTRLSVYSARSFDPFYRQIDQLRTEESIGPANIHLGFPPRGEGHVDCSRFILRDDRDLTDE